MNPVTVEVEPGFHSTICPDSVANRKRPDLPLIWKDVVELLKTAPVGPAAVETTSAWGIPLPLYKVATFVTSSAIQNGLVTANAIPHGFTRFGSVCAAIPGMSAARLVLRYPMVSACLVQ